MYSFQSLGHASRNPEVHANVSAAYAVNIESAP